MKALKSLEEKETDTGVMLTAKLREMSEMSPTHCGVWILKSGDFLLTMLQAIYNANSAQ